MMVEMQKCYDVLVKESNEIHAEVLLERAVKFDPLINLQEDQINWVMDLRQNNPKMPKAFAEKPTDNLNQVVEKANP